jgi:hypothetical protein
MSTRVTVLLTTPRLVTGLLGHPEERLSDALNRPLESVLRMTNATLGRLGNVGANLPVSVAVIPKAHIAVVYPEREVHAPADRRMRAYVPKQATEVFMLTAGLRIRGHAHAAGQLDPIQLHKLVLEQGDKFIALTQAWLAVDIEGTTEREVGLVLVNIRHIQFVAPLAPGLGPQSEQPQVLVRTP